MNELLTLMHDSAHRIGFHTQKLEEWLKENAKKMEAAGINCSVPFVITEYLKTSRKEIVSQLDDYYNNQKEKQKT